MLSLCCLMTTYQNHLCHKKNRALVNEYLDICKAKGCARCKEDRIKWMEIDHIDPFIKKFRVTQGHRSLKAVKKEMALCQILCYPCHKVKSAEDKVVIADMKRKQYLSPAYVSSQVSVVYFL